MRGWATLVLVAGCGRFAFNPGDGGSSSGDDSSQDDGGTGVGDALSLSHDEDGDTIADAVDVCPHVPDPTQDDQDGDRVGDACDLNPMTPSEQLVLFATFETTNPFNGAGWSLASDALHYAGAPAVSLKRAINLGTAEIWIGADVAARPGSVHQISMGAQGLPQNAHGYVELYDDANVRYTAASNFDGLTYMPVMTSPMAAVISGTLTLRYAYVPGAQTRHTILSNVGGVFYSASAMVMPATATEVEIDVRGVDVSIRYIAIIETL